MNIQNRNNTSLFEEFILLDDLILYCCRIGGLDEAVGNKMNTKIRWGFGFKTEALMRIDFSNVI